MKIVIQMGYCAKIAILENSVNIEKYIINELQKKLKLGTNYVVTEISLFNESKTLFCAAIYNGEKVLIFNEKADRFFIYSYGSRLMNPSGSMELYIKNKLESLLFNEISLQSFIDQAQAHTTSKEVYINHPYPRNFMSYDQAVLRKLTAKSTKVRLVNYEKNNSSI